MKATKCYIYTRVSTSMQVDGYSLDAQKEKLERYAEFQDMVIVGEYSDEGKSGKNIEGRPQFLQMLKDIEAMKDNVQYVLVFKLSRFGRNAADVLSSLQRMQDYGVNLICVEDGIDSSKDSGKLMISVLSAVAEIERENILVQTMEGRRQKARTDAIVIVLRRFNQPLLRLGLGFPFQQPQRQRAHQLGLAVGVQLRKAQIGCLRALRAFLILGIRLV